MSAAKTVLVAGATGRQGFAVAWELANRGHRVVAMSRRPDSAEARSLLHLGIPSVYGSYDSLRSLKRAMQGMDAVFVVTTPWEHGLAAEAHHGAVIAQAARIERVPHLIYSSARGANQLTGVTLLDTKHHVEHALARVPHTVLRPAWFIDNLLSGWLSSRLRQGRLSLPFSAWHPFEVTALADLGALVTHIIERPRTWLGRKVDIASDTCTPMSLARAVAVAAQSPVHHQHVTAASLGLGPTAASWYRWQATQSPNAEALRLRVALPEIGWHSVEDWVRDQDWEEMRPRRPRPEVRHA